MVVVVVSVSVSVYIAALPSLPPPCCVRLALFSLGVEGCGLLRVRGNYQALDGCLLACYCVSGSCAQCAATRALCSIS